MGVIGKPQREIHIPVTEPVTPTIPLPAPREPAPEPVFPAEPVPAPIPTGR